MRRLIRILGKIFSGVLLLVCLALIVLWVRSYWRMDDIGHIGTFEARGEFMLQWRGLSSEGGWIAARVTDYCCPTVEGRQHIQRRWVDSGYPPGWSHQSQGADAAAVQEYADDAGWGPLRWSSRQYPGAGSRIELRHLRVPHGILALVCGAWPLASLALAGRRAIRRRRRARAGRCLGCGYDLRASAERCPECGRATVARAGAEG